MASRNCNTSPNSFCYICGEFMVSDMKCVITKNVEDSYYVYFGRGVLFETFLNNLLVTWEQNITGRLLRNYSDLSDFLDAEWVWSCIFFIHTLIIFRVTVENTAKNKENVSIRRSWPWKNGTRVDGMWIWWPTIDGFWCEMSREPLTKGILKDKLWMLPVLRWNSLLFFWLYLFYECLCA